MDGKIFKIILRQMFIRDTRFAFFRLTNFLRCKLFIANGNGAWGAKKKRIFNCNCMVAAWGITGVFTRYGFIILIWRFSLSRMRCDMNEHGDSHSIEC